MNEGTPPESHRRIKSGVSIRGTLVGGMVGLLVLVVGVVSLSSFLSGRQATTSLARDIMENVAGYTIAESKAFLREARDAADLAQRLADSDVVDSADPSTMEQYFLHNLSLYEQFSGIYFGTPKGEFIFVSRSNDRIKNGFRTKHISVVDGQRNVRLVWKDRRQQKLDAENADDDRYDPRKRPWYTAAVAEAGLIWTAPYVFFSSQKPGITTASPVYGQDGALKGVVGVDIEIDALSRFIADRDVSDRGSAFIATLDGDVIAFPDPAKIRTPSKDPEKPPRLTRITEIDDALARAAHGALNEGPGRGPGRDEVTTNVFRTFEHGGETWHAMFAPFDDPQWPWVMGIYVPEEDFVGSIVENQVLNLKIVLVMGVAAILAVLFIARPIVRPMRRLQAQARAILRQDFDEPLDVRTPFREIRETAEAFERMKEGIRYHQDRYVLAALGASDALFDMDFTTDEAYFSPRTHAILGVSEGALAGGLSDWLNFVHDDDAPRVRAAFDAFLGAGGGTLEVEYRIRRADGVVRWVCTRGTAVRDRLGRAQRAAGSTSDVTDRKEAQDQLVFKARHDSLTGLLEHGPLIEEIDEVLGHAAESPDQPAAVLAVNLDRFRIVTDTLGQGAGDEMLVAVARRIDTCFRGEREAVVARVGGARFAVLVPQTDGEADAEEIAERVRRVVHEPLMLAGQEVFPSVSIGVTLAGASYRRGEDVISDAHLAMNHAREGGGGNVHLFRRLMREHATVGQLALETELRRAVDRNEFVLHYQPIVELGSGRVAGFEALMRWRHPERGMVSPGLFIPLAEETGLIVPMGLWALHAACRQLARWHDTGVARRDVFMSVNVSRRQVDRDGVVADVGRVLRETRLAPEALKLEVTESLIMKNAEASTDALRLLKETGVKVAMDDFGTGHSSLGLLPRLPIDTIKIDRVFVADMLENPQSRMIVESVTRLAHAFGMDVVAEGAEAQEEAEALAAMGCDYCQGYVYGRPLPPEEAEKFLAQPLKGVAE